MKSRSILKNQYYHYEHASNFHNKVRNIFITDNYFKQLNCYQEVPLKFLTSSYPNNYDSIDWWIDELGVVIELHGRQHYEATSFTKNISFSEKQKQFHNIKYRDNRKKTYLIENGYKYIEVSYKEKKNLTSDYLKNLIFD